MLGLLELSLMIGFLAGVIAYVCAYERARLSMGQRAARRAALAATPGPVIFYLALGGIIAVAVPYFVEH